MEILFRRIYVKVNFQRNDKVGWKLKFNVSFLSYKERHKFHIKNNKQKTSQS